MQTLLIVEDDAGIAAGLEYSLTQEGFGVVRCANRKGALEQLAARRFDLAVLDLSLPDGDGFSICRAAREKQRDMPVIFLTARDDEGSVVMGLDMGADDYITKPFSLAVLRARVNAQLRRGTPAPSACYEAEGLSLDFERMEFRRDGQIVELSKTEQKLLRVLVENRGRTVPRETLLDRVWTDGAEYVEENALSVTVKRLRDKLEETPSKPRLLKTVYGIGYTWVAK